MHWKVYLNFQFISYRSPRSAIGSAINAFATRRTLGRHKKKQTCMRQRRLPVLRHTQWELHRRLVHRHRLCRQDKIQWDIQWVPVATINRATMLVIWVTTIIWVRKFHSIKTKTISDKLIVSVATISNYQYMSFGTTAY